jgi:hypothetical protein
MNGKDVQNVEASEENATMKVKERFGYVADVSTK